LRLALERGIQTLAFPSISTGAYGYPVEKAAQVAIRAVRDFLLENPGKIREVRFVLFSAADFAAYRAAVKELLGV
jgi:O-acetyl-ADP-ribose deacetylase (regulator of RNase III)